MNPSSESWPVAIARPLPAARRFYTLVHVALVRGLVIGLAIGLAVGLEGCASGEFRASGEPGGSAYGGRVEVLESMPPEGSFERVGVVVARGVGLTGVDTMIEELQDQAAARGADAIVLQSGVKITQSAKGAERKSLGAWAIRRR